MRKLYGSFKADKQKLPFTNMYSFRLIPETKFTDIPRFRTRTMRATLFPLFSEKFDLGNFLLHNFRIINNLFGGFLNSDLT